MERPALSLADVFFLMSGIGFLFEVARETECLPSLSDSSSPNDVMNLIPPSNGDGDRDLEADAERRYCPYVGLARVA